jgi:hypothetical protein
MLFVFLYWGALSIIRPHKLSFSCLRASGFVMPITLRLWGGSPSILASITRQFIVAIRLTSALLVTQQALKGSRGHFLLQLIRQNISISLSTRPRSSIITDWLLSFTGNYTSKKRPQIKGGDRRLSFFSRIILMPCKVFQPATYYILLPCWHYDPAAGPLPSLIPAKNKWRIV